MENVELAWMFYLIADLLELKDENVFKIRAYRKAAHTLENFPERLADMSLEELAKVPGIGKNIAAKIEEAVKTGKLNYLEELKKTIPPGLRDIMNIPGVGPKTVRLMYEKLGIADLASLEAAARAKKIRELPGLGNKTEQNILRGIDLLRTRTNRYPLGIGLNLADEYVKFFLAVPGVTDASVAGSVRRRKDMVGDIDIVVAAKKPEKVMKLIKKHPMTREVLNMGETKASFITLLGMQIDVRVVSPEQFWTGLHHFTGSKEHNVRLREIAHKKGLKINEYGIFERDGRIPLPVKSEDDIYKYLDLTWIPPELREDTGEIEAAGEGTLPSLLEIEDIKGDLHLHSTWSDGVNGIEELVKAGQERGYEYIAITDHSKSLGIARGLTVERLHRQGEYIKNLNEELNNFTILRGIEVDILADGSLDYEDEVLEEMDVVVASIHSGFKQDEEKITSRIESAIKNPHVDIIAHPTGRLLGRRDPYSVDVERVLEAAAKTDTYLEINSSPDRLDLKDIYVRQAREMGIKIAVNTDAHDIRRMEEIKFGVSVARRGWLEKDDVINTRSLNELKKLLK